jgi:hypothetical protein
MKRAHRRRDGKSALDLIEEATHVLRSASPTTLSTYYAGAIPFVLGLLYFWMDMSRSPFANQHLAEAALGMTALFLWMKFCQALFVRRIHAQITAGRMPRWTARECWRVLLTQAIVQPSGLFIIPLASIPLLPLAWAYAYYQNVTVLGGAEPGGLSTVLKKSWRQASLWPGQNHLLLCFLSLFGLFVFVNWITVCVSLPQLIKMLFGVESIFTQSPASLFNTTFLTAVLGLSYLAIDPILKVVYALRCFYGESLQSGEDLKSDLKQFAETASTVAALVVLLALGGGTFARAAEAAPPDAPVSSPAPAPSQQVSPVELDRSLEKVIHERKYTWRMPREAVQQTDAEEGAIMRFLTRVGNLIRKWLSAVFDWIRWMLRKLFGGRSYSGGGSGSGYGWIMSLNMLLYALVAGVVVALAILIYRIWRGQRQAAPPVVSEAIQPVPDVADENIGADQLPEDGWTRLARELLQRGEFRLAMRAFYLASLAHLATRNLISLARFKSNRDYERELQRRAHAIPGLVPMFGENISVFERIWYGRHEATGEVVNQFAGNVEKIKAGA